MTGGSLLVVVGTVEEVVVGGGGGDEDVVEEGTVEVVVTGGAELVIGTVLESLGGRVVEEEVLVVGLVVAVVEVEGVWDGELVVTLNEAGY